LTWPLAKSLMQELHAGANMFQAQNLLSGQPFSLWRYLGALVGRQQPQVKE
jgi:hypothetical protein